MNPVSHPGAKMLSETMKARGWIALLILGGAFCALPSLAQIQVAGSLVVNLNPSALSNGPVSWITNAGTAGGVFEATGLTSSNPVVIPVGGGTKGILFDGNNFMQHMTAAGGSKMNLPAALSGTNAPYSIECWVMNPTTWSGDAETMVAWGVRGTSGFLTAFSYSAHGVQGAMDHWNNNMSWAPLPPVAAWHHLVYTFDGVTQKLYADGALNNSAIVSSNLVPTTTQPITLASQRNADGTFPAVGGYHGSLTLGTVRIHTAAMTASQVLNNFNVEKDTFVTAPTWLAASPTHRYNFNNPAAANAVGQIVLDSGSVGGSNGIVRGAASSASFTGTELALTGGSSATAPYVDLPNRMLSSLSVSNGGSGKVTLEGWVTVTGAQTWQRLFDFGSGTTGEVTAPGGTFNGSNYFMLAQNNTFRDWARCEVMNNGFHGGPNATATRNFGLANDNSGGYGMTCYAVSWEEASGEIIIYENGVAAARYTTTTKFNGIDDVNVWLGRSTWSGDANLQGSYDEFRIYNRVLTPGEVQKDFLSGPDTLALNPGAAIALHLQMPHTNLLAGYPDQVVVKADYAGISNVVVTTDPGILYSSSNTNVATISSNGLLQALANGSAVITATLDSASDSNTLNVVSDPGALLAVRLIVTNQMPVNATQQAAVRGDFANVSDVDLLASAQPTLTAANSNILSITPSGVVTGIGPGLSSVSATLSNLSSGPKNISVSFPADRFVFDSFGDGFWSIINQGNGNALATGGAGLTQATPTSGALEQQWEVLYNLQNGTFRLRSRTNWFCYGQNGASTVGPVIYTGGAAQQWYFVDVGGGYFRIISAQSDLALQTDNGNPAGIGLAPASSSAFQLWRFAYQTHYPKKGTGGYEGFWSQFNTSWAYNWGRDTGASLPAQFVFEPMQWGGSFPSPTTTQQQYDAWHSTTKPVYLLGFNEPDHTDQANMTVATAIGLWPQLLAMDVPLLSPATANTYGGWMSDFYTQAANLGYRVDYTAVHFYVNPDATGLMNNLQNAYNTWGRPVWLTEFSPVDWAGTATWSEQDNYNFLAEFMWMAEDQIWLKRYGLFPFSGTPSTNPWDGNGHRGDTFLNDGATLTPYGELFATWDADRTVRARTTYLIQNLATSFRLASSNSFGTPSASSIRVRDATTEWGLLAAPTSNRWYIVSLNDGRRLRDTAGALDLAPFGTTGAGLEWSFTGPDSKGYYYIVNPTLAHNLNGSGAAPGITFGTASSGTLNNNTRWRLVKPYQPLTIPAATSPTGLTASPSNHSVALSWSGTARFYNVYRGTTPGGPYSAAAMLLTNTAVADNTALNGVPYYYIVTGLNILAEESGFSAEASATASIAAGWRKQWFGDPANSGNGADSSDPDHDGIVNVLERAFNLNPIVVDVSGTPVGSVNGGNFTLTYRKSVAATDLGFQVVRSTDLVNWVTTGITDVLVSTDGVTDLRAATIPITGSTQFLRLQVTAP